ncbi:NSS family neurotransmitter:Na+ symporter [Isoptericola jiangsuensis]|uniref:NSS family neurotransmitter:Na+ symporter n=1 Tax=Isoptericola jiangsuensis TaxID=548579 RepID=A0A2A9F0B5_9MICO|nr:sodium-dependent transporter [Isoptericola jiangsuensis]PFG44837.1 NSS family neurotransmitter:Na+ symporter [Isoptericola jiangsuensis]
MSAEHKAAPREQFTGQVGFILSAIGSAVGLGNIWRFPGVAYENGGGAFMVPYLVALLTAGIPILFLDYALGHRFRGGAPQAFRRVKGWLESLGWFQVMICILIAVYYAVVVAWAGSFFVYSFGLDWGDDAASFFVGEHLQLADVGGADPWFTFDFVAAVLIPLVIVWVAVIAVLAAGVVKGVERANVVFIPLLVVAFGILVVRSLFLEGAVDGLNVLFTPDWSRLGDASVWIAAYGQIFFSLSVAFGIMITYSSYRARKANMTSPGLVVAFSNSGFELFAGLGVFSALGFLAAQEGVTVADLNFQGVLLAFVTFPTIVSQMPAGAFFGALFFGSLVMAGFTSLVSILQVVSAALQEKFALSRRAATLGMGITLGVVSVLGFSTTTGLILLDTVDAFVNNLGIVGSAVFMCVFVVWVYRKAPELRYHLNAVSTTQVGRWWYVCVGVIVPVMLVIMLVQYVIERIDKPYGDYDTTYLLITGWGSVLLLFVGAILFTLPRWRGREAFTVWPAYPPQDPAVMKEASR